MIFRCLIMLITFTFGCASSHNKFESNLLASMNTWKGHHISQLIGQIGPYSNVHSDGANGKIYTWQIDPQSLPSLVPPRQYRASTAQMAIAQAAAQAAYQERVLLRQQMLSMKRRFYVRPNGIIYFVRIDYLHY